MDLIYLKVFSRYNPDSFYKGETQIAILTETHKLPTPVVHRALVLKISTVTMQVLCPF